MCNILIHVIKYPSTVSVASIVSNCENELLKIRETIQRFYFHAENGHLFVHEFLFFFSNSFLSAIINEMTFKILVFSLRHWYPLIQSPGFLFAHSLLCSTKGFIKPLWWKFPLEGFEQVFLCSSCIILCLFIYLFFSIQVRTLVQRKKANKTLAYSTQR